ncbi:MAG: hypothetical protein ISS46_00545 [Candidatus Omnitrophica bacterium]|nr:hypothetical protein [Candidatus Omnitrophota bacterium]
MGRKRNESGVVFITALVMMLILLSLGMSYLVIARTRARIASNQRAVLKAFYIAEAGLEEAIDELFTDSGWGVGFTNESFGGGTYNVFLTGSQGETIEITSRGTFGGASRTIRAEVLVINPANLSEWIGSAGTGGGNVDFSGSSGTISGVVVVKGDFEAGDMDTDDARIIEDFSDLPVIEVYLDSYKTIADHVAEEDKGKDKDKDGDEETFTPPFKSGETYTGVYYIKGDVVIESNVTIYGTVVAEGDVNINATNVIIEAEGDSEEEWNPVEGYPAIIADGTINMDGMTNSSITGLVYATDDVKMDGTSGVTFEGGLIVGKDLAAKDGEDLSISYGLEIQPPYFTYDRNDVPEESTIYIISWKAYPGS